MKDIFYKKRYKELKSIFDEYNNNFKQYYDSNKNSVDRYENWIWDLLSSKSENEAKIISQKKRIESLEKKYQDKEVELDKIKTQYDDLLSCYKAEKQIRKKLSGSIGGLQKKNNDLLKKLGEQNMYIKLLKKEFEKRKIKTPTMKELMEYEITHKSPYQLKKEGKIDV